MNKSLIDDLLSRLNKAGALEAELLSEAAAAVKAVFPDAPAHPEVLAEPTEAVLHLIDRCLPGWSILLRGRAQEPDGHWHCTLRETAGSDNDEVIGIGRGPTVTLALLIALMRVAQIRAPD